MGIPQVAATSPTDLPQYFFETMVEIISEYDVEEQVAATAPTPSQTAVSEDDTSFAAAIMSRICGAKTGG